MASDFFYPNVGGVENHIYELGARLVARGHKVVVLTRSYGATHGRGGVRLLRTGVKVYYAPVPAWWRGTSLPVCTLALVRAVLVRERIDVVHTHQAGSALAHEAAYAAQLLGVPTVYTEHSLMDLRSLSAIALNMMMAFTLCDAAHVVCVSHCAKENLVLRARIDPDTVSVIPNAINAEEFAPAAVGDDDHDCDHDNDDGGQEKQEENQEKQENEDQEDEGERTVTVVILSRLVYRKGVDLAVAAIPRLCRAHACLRFVVGGDGPKRLALEEMREREALQERVAMLGEVPHDGVRAVLARGDIFLNCSLTEGFCIAIVEAAAAGLLVVTTAVGGIPEVLPRDMVLCTPPTVDGVVAAVTRALAALRTAPAAAARHRARQHARVARMYNWTDVARRTERVYARALARPRAPQRAPLRHLARKARLGWAAGPFWCAVGVLECLLLALCALLLAPRASIDPARELPRAHLARLCPAVAAGSPPPPDSSTQGETDFPATTATTM